MLRLSQLAMFSFFLNLSLEASTARTLWKVMEQISLVFIPNFKKAHNFTSLCVRVGYSSNSLE